MQNQQDWPDELDALRAATQCHSLLLENEFVRVLDTRIQPGEIVPLHTHRWPSALYIVNWSEPAAAATINPVEALRSE